MYPHKNLVYRAYFVNPVAFVNVLSLLNAESFFVF